MLKVKTARLQQGYMDGTHCRTSLPKPELKSAAMRHLIFRVWQAYMSHLDLIHIIGEHKAYALSIAADKNAKAKTMRRESREPETHVRSGYARQASKLR